MNHTSKETSDPKQHQFELPLEYLTQVNVELENCRIRQTQNVENALSYNIL